MLFAARFFVSVVCAKCDRMMVIIYLYNGGMKRFYYVLPGLFLGLGLLWFVFAFVFSASEADNVSTSVSVTNAEPELSSIIVTDDDDFSHDNLITPEPGANNIIYIKGIISDANGEDHIRSGVGSVAVSFYQDGQSCAFDSLGEIYTNNCYKSATTNHPTVSANANSAGPCVIDESYGSSLEARFRCPISLAFNTNSSIAGGGGSSYWVVSVKVLDEVGGAAMNAGTTTTTEIGLLTALDIEESISFGTMILGASTPDYEETAGNTLVLTQNGNDVTTVRVSSDANMICSDGSIPISNIKWSLAPFVFQNGTSLTGTLTETNAVIDYWTSDSVTKDEIYWGIQVPSSGVSGQCSGSITVSSMAA